MAPRPTGRHEGAPTTPRHEAGSPVASRLATRATDSRFTKGRCTLSNSKHKKHKKQKKQHKDSAPPEEVSREWQRWAALSLLDGQLLADVVATMVDEGVGEAPAAAVCARILANNPAYDAARVTLAQLHKLESFLDVRRQMQSLSTHPPAVDRRSGLSREQFLDEYYAENRPVLLADVCDLWPARGLWTPQYLVDTIGADVEVEVMADRDADPRYEVNAEDHRRTMRFEDYVGKLSASRKGNDAYLVANNQFLSSDAAAPLWEDFTVDPRYLRSDGERGRAFLWLGPAGTITPLHHDVMNVLFSQVVGRKRFRLYSPVDTPLLYNTLSVYSEVDPLAPDLERFPLFADATAIEVVVEPGETLFVPVGWWHHVVSLDLSMSVSFTNFAYDNEPEWYELESIE